MTELDQNFEPLVTGVLERVDGALCGCRGSRTMAESVNNAEQSSAIVDADRDRLVAREVLSWNGATCDGPLKWPQSTVFMHGPEPISTFR